MKLKHSVEYVVEGGEADLPRNKKKNIIKLPRG